MRSSWIFRFDLVRRHCRSTLISFIKGLSYFFLQNAYLKTFFYDFTLRIEIQLMQDLFCTTGVGFFNILVLILFNDSCTTDNLPCI